MHLAGAGHFQPAPLQRAAGEGDVDLGARLGEREERGAETQLQVVDLEEAAAEVGEGDLQVL